MCLAEVMSDAMSLMPQLQPCKRRKKIYVVYRTKKIKIMSPTGQSKELLESAHPLWWQGIE
jgi:hypothetical protein